RCLRPAFMRAAGTVQVLAFVSISSHFAPMVSAVRAAVRIVHSRARADIDSFCRSCATYEGSSEEGRALWCWTGEILLFFGSMCSRCPRQRAGFSPERYSLTVA